MELIREYEDSEYQGPAIKVGAGVEIGDVYEFVHANGLVIVGGNCPTVGLAGGFTLGGGIGLLSSKYGLAADQVLSAEVITASGNLVTASPTKNQDLFWALRGGGGGTFGVVTSMTIKAFPDTTFSTASLTVMDNGTNTDAIYSAIGIFFRSLPSLVDAGAWLVWVALPFGFMVTPAMVAGLRPEDLDALFKPTLTKMDELGLQYQYASKEHPDFLSSYYGSMQSTWNVSQYVMGGRMIPRELVENDASTEALLAVIRPMASQTGAVGVAFNVAGAVSSPDQVAANPQLRRTIFNLNIPLPLNYTNWAATREAQHKTTHDMMPALQALTPGGGAYLNEADPHELDWQTSFYGSHYERLLAIKHKYNPDGIFYARTGVGSERWEQRPDGRLCSV